MDSDFNFDDLLESELKVEEKLKPDSTFGVASEVQGEREMQTNNLIRQRLMETLKLKTLEQSPSLERENKVHNSQFSLTEQGSITEVSEDEFAEIMEDELSELMHGVNTTLVKSMDLSQDLPNIERVELSDFVLVEGNYTSIFIDFINNDNAVPKGSVPLCIKVQDNGSEKIVVIKEIQATPDILFRLKYFLEGFNFNIVSSGEVLDFNIYHYLGKIKLQEESA